MRNRDPFGAALDALRGQIRRGELPPGEPLVVVDLAGALGLSATPVREALAYLAGEGLIDGRRGKLRGYVTWTLSPTEAADLYRLHASQAALALAEAGRRGTPLRLRRELARSAAAASAPERAAAMAEAVFGRMVAAAGSRVIRQAHQVVVDRLHVVRRAEPAVLGDVGEELQAIAALEAGGVLLGHAVRAYHRRRIAEVERLVGAAQQAFRETSIEAVKNAEDIEPI